MEIVLGATPWGLWTSLPLGCRSTLEERLEV